jgi:hypothetical protein
VPKTPHSRPSRAPGPGFSFRWGIPVLDDLPFTVIYHFLLDHYAELGVDPVEMMFIIHLSQFRYETPSGQAAPGLPALARRMGYKDEQQVRRLKHRLEAKGLLRVTARPGLPDVYDVAPFAAAAFHLWEAEQQAATPIQLERGIESERGVQPDSPTPIQSERGGLSKQRGEKETRKTQQKKDDSNHTPPQEKRVGDDPLPYSVYITRVIGDYSCELGDEAHQASNTTQALRLWGQSGLDEAAFVDQLQEARRLTRIYQGRQGLGTIDNKMAYFFMVLRDRALRPAS